MQSDACKRLCTGQASPPFKDIGRNALLTGLGRGHSQLDPFAYPSDSEGKPQAVQEPDILEETESSSEDTDGNEITVPLPAKPEIEEKEPIEDTPELDGKGSDDSERVVIANDIASSGAVSDTPEGDSNEEILERYRKRVKQLEAAKQKKPDMVAFKQLRQASREGIVGHIPGIAPGFQVHGKGELAILGIHCNICGGIYNKGDGSAYAIVLSGGYADDDDTGSEFWYTGMGGQKNGIQVADQSWHITGNRSLKISHDKKLPVRVVRRKAASRASGVTMPTYIYEGLYNVVEAKIEAGTHGCKICRFKMVAVEGEACVSTKVEVPQKFKKVKLASTSTKPTLPLKRKSSMKVSVQTKKSTTSAAEQQSVLYKKKLAMSGITCLLARDFSEGAEKRRIPVYGESIDDLQFLPRNFCYVSSSVLDPGPAETIASWGRAAFEWKDACGIQAMGGAFVTKDSKLTETLEWGLHECGPSCTKRLCKNSQAVSRGVSLPLEIFKTKTRGWGLRCSVDIPIGRFICEYAGAVCTDTEADQRCQEYLFDLDHFVLLKNFAEPERQPNRTVYPELPSDLTDMVDRNRDVHLSIDGSQCGNVGRFINHSCDGNVVVQPVFTPGCSALFYRVALFALKDIPAYEELTYSYGWTPQENPEKEVWCSCGAANCQGRLL